MNASRIPSYAATAAVTLAICMLPFAYAGAQAPTTLAPASCSLKVGDLGEPQTQIKFTTGSRTVMATSIDLNGGTVANLGIPKPVADLTIYWTTGNNPTVPANSQAVFSGEAPDMGSFSSVSTFPITGLSPGTTYTFLLKDFHSSQSCSLGTVTTLSANGQNPTPAPTPNQNPSGAQGTPIGNGAGGSNQTPNGGAQGTPVGNGAGGANPNSPVQSDPSRLQNFTNIDSIPEAFGALLDKVIIPIAIPFVALAIIYTGFLFVEARGNQEKLNKAKEALKWTIIGSSIVLGAYVIAQVVENTVNEIRPTSADIHISEIHHV